jgi:hypothetical protein
VVKKCLPGHPFCRQTHPWFRKCSYPPTVSVDN